MNIRFLLVALGAYVATNGLASELDEDLVFSASFGSLTSVREALEAGANINAKHEVLGETALMAAINESHIGIVDFLLRSGADAGLSDSVGMTTLEYALMSDNLEIIKLVLEKGQGVDVNAPDMIDTRPLVSLLYDEDSEKLEVFLRYAKGLDVNFKDPTGSTPLHILCISGENERLLELLLQVEGINVNVTDPLGQTPLHSLVSTGKVDMLRVFLKHAKGLDPNQSSIMGNAVDLAILVENQQILEVLLREIPNLDLNSIGNQGTTVLGKAVMSGKVELVRMLLDLRSEIDVNLRDGSGFRAIDYSENDEIRRLLSR